MARKIVIGVLGAIGGILGNLMAAIAQSSLGTITPFQLAGMVIGILAMIILVSVIESRAIRTDHQDAERRILLDELAQRRALIHQLLNRQRAGVPTDVADVDEWLENQERIRVLKERLRSIGCSIPSDPIDEAPPPQIGCLYRFSLVLKQAFGSLFVLPFLIALTISFVASPWIQQIIIDYMDYVPKPNPVLIETPTPFGTPTVVASPSPTPTSTMTTPNPVSDESASSVTDAEDSSINEQMLALLTGCEPGRRIIEPKHNDELTYGDMVEVWGEIEPRYPDYAYYEVAWAPGIVPDDREFRLLFKGEIGANEIIRFGLWDTRDLKPGMTYALRLRIVRDDGNWDPLCTVTVRVR